MAGWNIQTWGLGTWGLLGDVNVPVTGQALTASLGNESVKTDVILFLLDFLLLQLPQLQQQ